MRNVSCSLCNAEGCCDVGCRKVRLQIKDETEREEAEIKAVHAEKLRKLQQDIEQQLTEEKSKIRYQLKISNSRYTQFYLVLLTKHLIKFGAFA